MEAPDFEVAVGEPFVGEIRPLFDPTAPEGWVPCDGRLLDVLEHPVLFEVIGDSFGGDGASTFAIPALSGTHRPAGNFIICTTDAVVGPTASAPPV